MSKRKRINRRNRQQSQPVKAEPAKTKSFGSSGGLRYALSQGHPGRWASDHREEAKHFTGWNYVAINAVAKQAAQADVSVYRDGNTPQAKVFRKSIRALPYVIRKDYGEDERAGMKLDNESSLMRLMSRPSPHQSGASFRYEQVMQLMLTGTCLVWNVKNGAGLPCERYVIPTAVAYPVRPCVELPSGGWRIDPAACSMWSNQLMDEQGFTELGGFMQAIGRVIPAEDIQTIRNPHPIWKDDGYSALSAGSKIIDSAEQVDTARYSAMHNRASPSVLIEVPAEFDLTEEQLDAITNKFNSKYAGPENDGKAMFVTGGGKATKLDTNAKEMDFVAAFTQLRDAIMSLHAVPGVAAGITDGGSYAAFYASLKQFTTLTVQPILSLLGEEDTEQLAPAFGQGLTVEIECAAIDDPDILERQLQTDLQAGIRTRGELRALRGLKPFGDERDNEIAGQPAAGSQASPTAFGGSFSTQGPDMASERSTGQSQGFPSVDEIVSGVSKRLSAIQKLNGPHEFSCTMINIAECCYSRTQGPVTDKILRMALAIPDEDITEGREIEPHVTVKYGTHTQDPEEMRAVVEGFGPVRFTLGKTSIFRGEEQDVVKIDVNSLDLQRLNALITSSLPNTTKHPIYQPHITLAYVKAGLGEKYAGLDDLEGADLTASVVVFSGQSNSKTKINLVKEQKRHTNGFHRESVVERSLRGAIKGARDGAESDAEFESIMRGVRWS